MLAAVLTLDSAVARLGVYADDDGLAVWSPQATASGDIAGGVGAEAGYAADVITAATVDVRTAASPRGYQETRHEVHAGPHWELRPGTAVRATYSWSTERDYRSHVVSAGGAHDLLGRRLTLSVLARFLADEVGRAGEASFAKPLRGYGGDVGAAVVVDRRTVAGVTYAVQRLDGFQASPYRFVPIRDGAGEVRASLPEAVPDGRLRHAMSVDARRALSSRFFARGAYRVYADSWGVRSHTAEGELARSLGGDRATVALRARGYTQGPADFHEARYATWPMLPRWRDADKKLGRNRSVLGGVRADFGVGAIGPLREVRAEASLDVYDQWFLDFPALRRRRAALVGLGWSAQW
ncbi:MAG: DUF3570 domain-containing protein [Myxococcota bacterium]